MSKLRLAIEKAGLANVARRMNVTSARLSNWLTRGVPVEKCYALERALGGEVTRRDMRDDWSEIWPELAVNESIVPFASMPSDVQRRRLAEER